VIYKISIYLINLNTYLKTNKKINNLKLKISINEKKKNIYFKMTQNCSTKK